jgi:hypothetical protein
MKKLFVLLGLGLWLTHANAEERPEVSEGNVPQGEVILQGGSGPQLQEFRRDGEVYKVKVTPRKGRPYFLVDSDGNGSLDQVQWILFSW